MTVPVPQLDDRRWNDLVEEARAYLTGRTNAWTDFSPGDPGIVLVELFAHLTELMIYRLNRVPEKAFLEYLRLIGLSMRPPAAAAVELQFEADQVATAPIVIPRGVRVSVNRGGSEPPVFVTADAVTIATGEKTVAALAHHCEYVSGELLGLGTGAPGQILRLQRAPVIAPSGHELDLVIGVEATPDDLTGRAAARDHEGKAFRIWEAADSFVNHDADATIYVADRNTGQIVFAPALDRPGATEDGSRPATAVPGAGREIRAWYRRGGGPGGNVPAGAITVLKDTVPGVRGVVNPQAATGGRPAETIEEALVRGPQELHAIERALTAQDYEAVALRAGGAVVRARAFTKAGVWAHAAPGTVELLLVPYVDPAELGGGRLSARILHDHETAAAADQVQMAVEKRRPLGITCEIGWASYKTVKVAARVVVRREENQEAVRQRVQDRLHTTISPLPSSRNRSAGWRWGSALRASHVFDMVLKEPGVQFVDNVRLIVEYAPDAEVMALARDAFQPRCWFAGSKDTVFRSLNDAQSWEALATFSGETVRRVETHAEVPGLVAVVTSVTGGSRLHVSRDDGETWDVQPVRAPEFDVNDIAWSVKGDQPVLLVAADAGLFELGLEPGDTFVPIQVTPKQTAGFYAVVATLDALGARNVAVAGQGGGVWVSSRGGAPQTFRGLGLDKEDIRVLAIQRDGPRAFLWSAAAAGGAEEPGKGAWRWELRGDDAPAEGWIPYGRNWNAGSCWGLAFDDGWVYAATHHGGVLRANARRSDAPWEPVPFPCGLPPRDPTKFLYEQVDAVAAGGGLVLAGGMEGVFASTDGSTYEAASHRVRTDAVALPETWLFVSSEEHDITIVTQDEAGR